MTSLHDQLDASDNFAEAFIPEAAGEKLVGEVTRVDTRSNEYGTYTIITVLDEASGEERAFHAQRTVARSQVEKADPRVGDRIGIVYRGQKRGKRGSYHDYKVVVERAEPAAV